MKDDATIKIDKGIPPPERGGWCYRRYPFGDMVVGDSFVVPHEVSMEHQRLVSLRSAASVFGRRNNMKFSVRKAEVAKDGTVTYRCWRIE